MTPQERLIIALDVPSIDGADQLIGQLDGVGHFFKIGYQLFPLGGYDLARGLVRQGKEVFLDAKLFDIGATVERGVRSLISIGASVLTVHADPDTIKGAVAGRSDDRRLKLFAVTVLTSWDQVAINAHRIEMGVMDLVLHRAEMAAEGGADGVIASAKEAAAIKARFGDRLQIITPGIRPAGVSTDDQKRVVTPDAAIAAGADRIVVGRPITKADDPAAVAERILAVLSKT